MIKNNKEIGELIPTKEIVNLDKKNQKLISLLLQDATLSFSQLSKELQISKSNIARRMSILKEKGIITGYHAFIDITKLGLHAGILSIQTSDYQNKDDFLKQLLKKEFIYGILEMTGKYNLMMGLYFKDNTDKNKKIEQIFSSIEIKDFQFNRIKTFFPQLDYTKELFSKTKITNPKKIIEIKIDYTDLKLIDEISKDCRQSKVNLAEKLKISRETVNYKLKRLINNKIITKFQANVNPFILGFEAYFLTIKLSKPTQEEKLISFLNKSLRCNTILCSEGSWDIATFIHFKSHKEFREFENKLLEQFRESILEYSFEYGKKQYKLDWFNKEVMK